jgi:hypothetical protein
MKDYYFSDDIYTLKIFTYNKNLSPLKKENTK